MVNKAGGLSVQTEAHDQLVGVDDRSDMKPSCAEKFIPPTRWTSSCALGHRRQLRRGAVANCGYPMVAPTAL
jgi:hypothetical protein